MGPGMASATLTPCARSCGVVPGCIHRTDKLLILPPPKGRIDRPGQPPEPEPSITFRPLVPILLIPAVPTGCFRVPVVTNTVFPAVNSLFILGLPAVKWGCPIPRIIILIPVKAPSHLDRILITQEQECRLKKSSTRWR